MARLSIPHNASDFSNRYSRLFNKQNSVDGSQHRKTTGSSRESKFLGTRSQGVPGHVSTSYLGRSLDSLKMV
jgi:hypothetical protein